MKRKRKEKTRTIWSRRRKASLAFVSLGFETVSALEGRLT